MTDSNLLNSKLSIIKLDARLANLKKKTGLIIQSLLFPISKYTKNSAEKWAKEKGYKTNKIDIPGKGGFIHLTQKIAGRFNIYKTLDIGEGVKARMAGSNVSKFAGQMMVKGFSKFSDNIKSELDIKIPMDIELKILSDGPNRDGTITRGDMEDALDRWSVPIIDWHNMDDMKNPTGHKITDRKGSGAKAKVRLIDGKYWTVLEGQITDRYLAYLIYLADKQGKPYDISAEYGWTPYWNGGEKIQSNINPHLITITDNGNGHIEGNKLTIKSAS